MGFSKPPTSNALDAMECKDITQSVVDFDVGKAGIKPDTNTTLNLKLETLR